MERRAFVLDTEKGQLVPLEGEENDPATLPPLVNSLCGRTTMEELGKRIAETRSSMAALVKVICVRPEKDEPIQISFELVAPTGSPKVKQSRVADAARTLVANGFPPNSIVHVEKHRFPRLSGTAEKPATLGDLIQDANTTLQEPKKLPLRQQHPDPNTVQKKRRRNNTLIHW